MVILKSAVLDKLQELESYCVAADSERSSPSPELIRGFFSPVKAAVNSYYSNRRDVSALFNEVIEFMYFDLYRRNVSYENNFDFKLRQDFPVGYNDISLCFYQFAAILSASGSAVYAAFVYGVPVAADGDSAAAGIEVPLSNSTLTAWAAEILLQADEDVSRLNALSEWCQDCGNADLVSLFEDQGRVVSRVGVRDGGVKIYLERNALSVIESYPLSTHIPSWLEGFYLNSYGDIAIGRITTPMTFELDGSGDARLCMPATASTYFEIDSAGDIVVRGDN